MKHVTQVVGAPASVQRLRSPRNRKAIRRHILEKWIKVGRQKIIVAVTRDKDFSDWLRKSGLPDNIIIEDFDVAPNSPDMMAAFERYEADLSIWAVIAF
jgi:peptidyl-tRNA hydrolase